MSRPKKPRRRTTRLQITALGTLTALCLAQPVQAGFCDWCEKNVIRPLGKMVKGSGQATGALLKATGNAGEIVGQCCDG